MRQRSALRQQMVLALTLTLVLVLRFFNYRVVPDIPPLITSLDIRYKKSTLRDTYDSHDITT